MSAKPLLTAEELVSHVNAWANSQNLIPANGQSAEQLSMRTLRYYRTLGLLSAPMAGAKKGYGEIHSLQLLAIRILQSHGLPLQRIQSLLYGRSVADLKVVVKKGGIAATESNPSTRLPMPEDWRVMPFDDSAWLILRHGRTLSTDQISQIKSILGTKPSPVPSQIETERTS